MARRSAPAYTGNAQMGLGGALAKAQARLGRQVVEIPETAKVIPDWMTFRQWCEKLGSDGLKVDGAPFRLDDRPALAWVYDQVPSTIDEANRLILVLQKCAQVGFTVAEMLACIYMALKFEPCKIGMFLPVRDLAAGKSSERFMPIMRTVPEAYDRLTATDDGGGRKKGEGNVLIRSMGDSRFHFLWTSGKATTESYPMDVLSFDEVQEMDIADMEKTMERVSASRIKFTLMGSTANWPDSDINWWYKKGDQWRFHTRCQTCGREEPLDEYFPECIKFDPDRRDYRYVCREGHWIDDSQLGEWRPTRELSAEQVEIPPEDGEGVPLVGIRRIKSIHFHQMLSPTITPRDVIEKYLNADDLQNFWNRVLGKPYTDPSQVPVTMEHLAKCVEAGREAGVEWKTRASNTYMGIDQMGRFNVAIIKERLPDGKQAVIHAELIYADDPFARCDELMEHYGVQVCVVETLPNYNDAKRFAGRHPGRVFLAQYAKIEEAPMRWGDAPRLDISERRTAEEDRDRYTVTLDQYKCMQMAMARIVNTICLFPDPTGLRQEVDDKGVKEYKHVLKDVYFLHFTKTALITERIDRDERKLRRRVVKVGIDPHASYANMLCDVAWARAHGTATFILPTAGRELADRRVRAANQNMPGLPHHVMGMLEGEDRDVCGRCSAFTEAFVGATSGLCAERNCGVGVADPGCPFWLSRS